MNKFELQLKFSKIRKIHTTSILLIVLLLMGIVFYTYTYGPLVDVNFDGKLLILIAAIINLSIVFASVGVKRKKTRKMNTEAPMQEKLKDFSSAHRSQLALTGSFVLIDALGFLLTGNKILFLFGFVMLIYLLSLNPTKEKFIKGAALSKEEKKIFLY